MALKSEVRVKRVLGMCLVRVLIFLFLLKEKKKRVCG